MVDDVVTIWYESGRVLVISLFVPEGVIRGIGTALVDDLCI